MDFTLKKYKELLNSLIDQGYEFQTFHEFIKAPKKKSIVLRHDVDLMPQNSLAFAKVQYEKGVKGVYYFRAVKQSWDESVIKEISDMGHEIGYHYENLTTCNGNMKLAHADFESNLKKLNNLSPVTTICMHGSPMSKYDSKDLWKDKNYQDLGIIGEPYFDVDFNEVGYLTDTGRRWDGDKVSVRDKVNSKYSYSFSTTDDVIGAISKGELPDKVMFTFHPQRWNDKKGLWFKELIYQKMKNVIKKYLFVKS